MKIYFGIDENDCFNPYVSILIKRLKEIDDTLEVVSGIQTFWNEEILSCNIIHIHWPDILLKNTNRTPEDLKLRLQAIKEKGGKIVATCHNIKPHFAKFPWQTEAYTVVYELCDMILHMGNYSQNLFKELYPRSRHEILPHHIYDDRYKDPVTKEEAAKKLGLSTKYTYILCLGAFRDQQERDLLLGLTDFLKKNSIKILAPSFFIERKTKGIRIYLRHAKTKLKCLLLNLLHNIKTSAKIIPEEEIPLFGAMADLMLLQRVVILNSGNTSMGFYLGKVVVGPDTGNVGPFLKESGNPVFEVGSKESLISNIKEGLAQAAAGYGQKNKTYAQRHLSSKTISRQLLDFYKSLL